MNGSKGQTTVDFAIAISIFFVAIIFTLTLVPTLFQPYESKASEKATSERLAKTISKNVLTNPNEEYILNESCTEEFFVQTNGMLNNIGGPDCRFDDGALSLRQMFRFDSTVFVNVTIEDSSGNVRNFNGSTMAAGPNPPEVADTSVSKRVVFFDNDQHYLKVTTW